MTYTTRATLDSLMEAYDEECNKLMTDASPAMHAISIMASAWAGKHKLTSKELPNVFCVINGSSASASRASLGEYQNASWIVPKGEALKPKLAVIRGLLAEAIENDKLHFAQLKLDAIAEATAAAEAFA